MKNRRSPKSASPALRLRNRLIALEPRILFDGVALVDPLVVAQESGVDIGKADTVSSEPTADALLSPAVPANVTSQENEIDSSASSEHVSETQVSGISPETADTDSQPQPVHDNETPSSESAQQTPLTQTSDATAANSVMSESESSVTNEQVDGSTTPEPGKIEELASSAQQGKAQADSSSAGTSETAPLTTTQDGNVAVELITQEQANSGESTENSSSSKDEVSAKDADLAEPKVTEPKTPETVVEAREVVFYDERQAALAEALAETSTWMEIIALDNSRDGIEQIREALGQGGPVSAVHILTHGSEGAISLGSTALTQANMDAHASGLSGWADSLTEDADILIYGCDVGEGTAGEEFVAKLAGLTGADIAASTDATGATALGGNWVLEKHSGVIEATTLSLTSYSALLTAPTGAPQTPVNISETTIKSFTGENFGFSDSDSHTLASIIITTLPNAADGLLLLDGTPVVLNQVIDVSDFGKLTFTPADKIANYTGTFQFKVRDSSGETSVSSYAYSQGVTATNNHAPVAVADTAAIAEDSASITGNVLTNDTDIDTNDTKTLTAIAGGTPGQALTSSYGSITLDSAGNYTYTVDNANTAVQALGVGQTLTETFTYTVKDANNQTSTATLTVTITGTNDAPVVTTSSLTITMPVPENATDAENPGTAISSLLVDVTGKSLVTDVDATDSSFGIAVYDSVTTDGMTGHWEYLLTGSSTWTSFTPSVSAATLLPADAKVRFVADHNADDAKESGNATLKYYAWDGHGTPGGTLDVADGNRGGTSAISVNAVNATLTIAPRNDQPVLTQNTITLNEHGTGSIVLTANLDPKNTTDSAKHLYLFDPDNSNDQVMYRVEALPTAGKLYKNNIEMGVGSLFTQADVANGLIKYTYTGSELSADRTDSFRVSVRDGAGGIIGASGATGANPWATITLNIVDVNAQVGVASNTFGTTEYANSGDHLDLTGLKPYDPDAAGSPAGFPKLAVETLPANGTLQYWNGSAYVDMTAADLRSGASTVWFNDADLTMHPLRYVPSAGEPSSYGGQTSFNVYVDDGGRTGNPGAATNATTAVTISVSPYNDVPTAASNTLTLHQRDANVTITSTAGTGNIIVSDPDSDAGKRVYTISAAPAHGYLTLDGVRVGVGAAFTQADLDAGKLKFTHDSTEPSAYAYADRIDFTVTDGDGGQISSFLNLHIDNVNDAPVPDTHYAYTNSNLSITIGNGILNASDVDSPASNRTYVVTSLPTAGVLKLDGADLAVNQTFTQADIDAGRLTYVPNSQSANAYDSFNFTVNDGEASNNTATGKIEINPTGGSTGSNPINGNHAGLVAEGLFVKFTQSQIDGGNGNTLKLVEVPKHGKLYLNGAEVTVGGVFAQSDINSGNLVYVSDGSEPSGYNHVETFKIARADDSNVTTITLTVTPVDDAPIIDQASSTIGTVQEANTGGGDANSLGLSNVTNAAKLTTTQLSGRDIDTADAQLYYVVESAPTNGSLRHWNGLAWITLTTGSTFNVLDVTAGKIAYFHDPDSELRADSFKVYLIDGAVVQTGDVVIGNPISESSTLTVSDGSTTIYLNKDAVMRSPSRTVNVTISDVNDAPVVASTRFAVDEGIGETSATRPTNAASIKVLDTSILAVTDSDDNVSAFNNGSGQGYYTLVALPTKGWIQISNGTTWTDMTAGQQFAHSDITSGRLRYVHDGSESAADSFQYTAADPRGGSGNTATVNIGIRPLNDPPKVTGTLTLGGDGSSIVPEAGARKITAAMLGVTLGETDPDNTSNQVQYRITSISSLHGNLYLGDSATGVPAKTLGVGSVVTLQNILDGKLWYQHDGTDPDTYGRTASFGFQISDSSGMDEPTGTFTIAIVPVNDAPVVTGLSGGATFTEGDTGSSPNVSPILIDSSITLADNDLANNNADFRGGFLRIAYASGGSLHDQLSVKNIGTAAGQVGINGRNISYGGVLIGTIDATDDGQNGNALKINFTNGAANTALTIPAVKALIEALTFAHTEYDNAVTGTRTLSYTLVDGGGDTDYTDDRNRTFDGKDTWAGSATVTVVAANDRPVLTPHTGGGNLELGSITEDATSNAGMQVGSFLTTVNGTADGTHTGIVDVDTGALQGIAITGVTAFGTGKWQYSSNGTTWTDVGTVSSANALLLGANDYLRYLPDAKDGGTATFTYKAWDQTTGTARTKVNTGSTTQTSAFSSATDVAQITVTPINDAPTLTGINSNGVTATEDTTFSFTGTDKLALSDVDSGSNRIKLTLTFTGSGKFQFSGSTTGIFTDEAGTTAQATWTGFEHGNTLTVYGTTTALNALLATLQYVPGIDANDRNLASQSATAQPSIKVDVDDLGWGSNGISTGPGLTATKTITIQITPVNDAPTLALNAATFEVNENAIATAVSVNMTFADPSDIDNNNYATTGTALPYLEITSQHGNLSFGTATGVTLVSGQGSRTLVLRGTMADLTAALSAGNHQLFYQPDAQFSGLDNIGLTLHDNGNAGTGGDKTALGSIAVTVGGVNDAPAFSGLDATPTFAENGNPVVLDSNAMLSDPELSNYNNWGNATLTLTRLGGAHADDVFGFTGNGTSGVNTSGTTLRIGTSAIGTISNTGGTLAITFAAGTTTAQVNQVLQALTYSNTNNNPPGNVSIGYTIEDGDIDPDRAGNGQGTGGNKSGTGQITVTVTATNDRPSLTGINAGTYTEDATPVVLAGAALASDPELSYFASQTGDWGGATLTVSRSGTANASDVFSNLGTLAALNEGQALVDNGVTIGTVTTNSAGTLKLTFNDGIKTAQVQSAIRQIAYSNSDQTRPAGATANITLNWLLDDGDSDNSPRTNDQGSGGHLATTVSQTITLTGANDAPVLVDTNLAVSQTEDAAIPVGAVGTSVSALTAGLSDVDASSVKGIAVIAADATMGQWYYSINGGTSWQQMTPVAANDALLLRSTDLVYFAPAGNVNGTVAAGLTIRAWDQTSQTAGAKADTTVNGTTTAFSAGTDTVQLTVTAVNDAPTRTASSVSMTIGEDTANPAGDTVQNLFGSVFSDGADNQTNFTSGSAANSLAGIAIVGNAAIVGQGKWQYHNGTGWVDISTSISSASAVLLESTDLVRFLPAEDFHGTPGKLTVRLIDSSSGAVTTGSTADLSNDAGKSGGTTRYSNSANAVDLTVTVTAFNDAPGLSGSTSLTAASEGAASVGRSASSIASALTYTDATDNKTAINGGGNTSTSQTALAIVGNAATAIQGTWQYTLDGTTWNDVPTSVSDATAIVLSLSNANHQVRFVPNGDFNGAPGSLTVRGADGSWNANTGLVDISSAVGGTQSWSTSTATVGITVNPVNDAPVVNNLDATPTFTEGVDTASNRTVLGTPVLIDGSVTIADVELVTQGVDNFGGATLTIARSNGSNGFSVNAQDVFGIATGGTIALAGNMISVGGIAVADVSGNNSSQLVITFRSNAGSAEVNAIASAITYANASDTPPGNVSVRYRFNDDNQGPQGSGGALYGDATITVAIVASNDPPLAVNDSASITEDATPNTVTGNVITTGPGADSDPESDPLTVTAIRTGGEAGTGNAGVVGSALAGTYGSITLNADGNYSYALDNNNAAVNQLKDGQTLTEVYTYTISDGNGGTDVAQLTITIHGKSDGTPSISATDLNGATSGQAEVFEAGLTSAADTRETVTGTIDLQAPDGLASISVGGTTVSLAQLGTLGTAPVVIDTGEGTLTLAGFTPGATVGGVPVTGTVTYNYVLKQALNQAGVTESTDSIALSITDASSGTANGTFVVRIVDDTPTANSDTATIAENATPDTVSGNVVTNDRIGADTAANPVSAISFIGSAKTVGTTFATTFGTMVINADGSYTYTVDNTNAVVNALTPASAPLTEAVSYTVIDGDGDTSTSTLTIAITGANDAPILVDTLRSITQIEDAAPPAGAVGTLVTDIIGVGGVTDVDAGAPASGMALTAADTSKGSWYYSIDNGTSWTALGVVSNTSALLLGPDARLYFKPNADANTSDNAAGTSMPIAAGLTFRAWDRTSGNAGQIVDASVNGGSTTISAQSDTVRLVISPVNDAPAITGLDAISVNASAANPYVPGAGGVVIDPDVTLGDRELGNERNNWDGATLVLARKNGASADDVFGASGALSLTGGNIVVGVKTIGTFTNAGGTLAMTFNGNATTALVNEAARSVTYSNGLATPTYSSVTLTWTLNDQNSDASGSGVAGTGTDQGDGGRLQASAEIVISLNQPPVAVADTATALERGGLNNATAGADPTGNVLTNDTDPDPVDTKTVTTSGTFTGTYGTLTLNADGSYGYVVDNSNAQVQALRTTANTLTDTFSYTMRDAAGLTSTSTLTITIQGANDTPVANDDTATAVEAGGVRNGTAGSDPSGNVLSNDSDVDGGDTKTVITTGSIAGSYGSFMLNSDGSYTYTLDNGNAAVQALRTGADTLTDTVAYTMRDTAGATSSATLTVTIRGANDAPEAVDDTATAVEASGVRNGTAGTDPGGNVLSNDLDVDRDDTKTVTTVGSFIGKYGTLTLNADGSYTYKLDNANSVVDALRDGETLQESFNYTMRDTDGARSSAVLTITIEGRNDTPVAVNDTAVAVEAGGLKNGVPGSDPTGNVLVNDSDVDGGDTKSVASVGQLSGSYGTLTLGADGSYTYAVDNSNPTVQALRTSGDTLTDTITYTLKDAAGATSTATLTVTIRGANDTPEAQDDIATAVEAGGMENAVPGRDPSGNVLGNDTDVDANDAKTVISTGTFTLRYGALTLNSDGSYTYRLDNNNPAVESLAAGQSLSEVFTYTMRDTAGATSTANLTIVIQGADDVLLNPIKPEGPVVPLPSNASGASTPSPPGVIAPVSPVGGDSSGTTGRSLALFAAPPESRIDDAGARFTLRVGTESGQNGSSSFSNSESRKLESTDRGFPVERLKAEANEGGVVDNQQKGGDKLFVFKGIGDTMGRVGSSIDYRVPREAFGHTDPNAIVQLEATLSDGNPLPEWIDFDPTSGTFSGKPPSDAAVQVEVKVVARDNDGREASTTFRLQIEGGKQTSDADPAEKAQKTTSARPGKDIAKRGVPFSEQIKQARRGDPLLDRLVAGMDAKGAASKPIVPKTSI